MNGRGASPGCDGLPPVLLLDLDDTIVAYSVGAPNYWEAAYHRHAAPRPDLPSAAFLEAIDAVAREFWSEPRRAHLGRLDLFAARRRIARLAFERLGLPGAACADAVADCFTQLKEDGVAPFPGAIEALDELRRRGIRMGLVTNGSSEFQRRKLERYALAPYFEAIVIEGELGTGKPTAAAFRCALERLEVDPCDAWMVGDNLEADIAGANALGIHAVWHNPLGLPLPDPCPGRPDRSIAHLRELLGDDDAPAGATAPGHGGPGVRRGPKP